MKKETLLIRTIFINGVSISRIVIDDHVGKHPDISHDVIIDLVRMLDGTENAPDDVSQGFEYFVSHLVLNQKSYKLVWLLESNQVYIGIITAHRTRRPK